MKRRDAMKGMAAASAGLVLGSISRRAAAQISFMTLSPMPVCYVAHGSPLLLADPVRGSELARWGSSLPRPRGIVVMTPHYRAQKLEISRVGKGAGMYNVPDWIGAKMPQKKYETPDNAELVALVQQQLSELNGGPLAVANRPGFDHTTWIPLFHMFPSADIPVVEIAMPFVREVAFVAVGAMLAPLREKGILILASGTLTHNLASADVEGRTEPPSWALAFDAWVKKSLEDDRALSIMKWREEAPHADVAHPDDGGHFRMLVVALGAAMKDGSVGKVRFPVQGFELGSVSKRCVQFG